MRLEFPGRFKATNYGRRNSLNHFWDRLRRKSMVADKTLSQRTNAFV